MRLAAAASSALPLLARSGGDRRANDALRMTVVHIHAALPASH